MSNYLKEAFKELQLLEDAYDLRDDEDIEALGKQLDVDDSLEGIEMIVDVEADDESELKDTYVGKVLLWCPICHTLHYADEEDVVVDEESSDEEEKYVNIEEICPECHERGQGFIVKGKVAPYDEEVAEKEDKEVKAIKDKKDEEEIEFEDEEEIKEESLNKKSLSEKMKIKRDSDRAIRSTTLLEQVVKGDLCGYLVKEDDEEDEDVTFIELDEEESKFSKKAGRKFAKREELEDCKLKESQADYYVLSDGKNPKRSKVFTEIKNAEF